MSGSICCYNKLFDYILYSPVVLARLSGCACPEFNLISAISIQCPTD